MRAIKFDEITVTFQPNNPKIPTIIKTEKKQLKRGMNTQRKLLKTNHKVQIIKRKTPAPKTTISFFHKSSYHQQSLGFHPNEFWKNLHTFL